MVKLDLVPRIPPWSEIVAEALKQRDRVIEDMRRAQEPYKILSVAVAKCGLLDIAHLSVYGAMSRATITLPGASRCIDPIRTLGEKISEKLAEAGLRENKPPAVRNRALFERQITLTWYLNNQATILATFKVPPNAIDMLIDTHTETSTHTVYTIRTAENVPIFIGETLQGLIPADIPF